MASGQDDAAAQPDTPHKPLHIRRSDEENEPTVTVESEDFFSPPAGNAAPVHTAADSGSTPPPAPPEPEQAEPEEPEEEQVARRAPKRGYLMLILQAILSVAALFQLYRTQMLPTLYLVVLAALLALIWLLFQQCQRYKVRGFLTRVCSLILSAALALGCVYAEQGLQALADITSDLPIGVRADAITSEPFIVYLSGVDTRGELTENARSDVNILAVINPETKRVALINTPRDYYVDLAGTDSKDKLTHAGLYGVETSMETLANLYGIDVDHYIRINFAGFMSLVDALGGIDVYSDYTFTSVGSPGYYDPTDFTEGWNHLDGAAALAFARERHAFATGDVQRGINQMKVIEAMLDKVKSPAILTSYSKLMGSLSDCFVTSLSSGQISALVRMQLSDFASWSVESYSVTGTDSSSTSCYSARGQSLYVMKPDESSVAAAKELIRSVCAGEAAQETEAASEAA